MVTQAQISHDFYQRLKENAVKRKHKADYFKPFWKTKKGHWKLIYPGIDEIEGLNCMLTVQCLDCGAVLMRNARHWLIDRNRCGCSNCRDHRGVAEKVKAIEKQGFEVLSAEVKGKLRVYTMKCPKCGVVFSKSVSKLGRWIKHGAKCPGCLNKNLPPDAVRIRKARIEGGMTYLDIAEKASYSESRVRNIANNIDYNTEVAKHIADAAKKIVKDKQ